MTFGLFSGSAWNLRRLDEVDLYLMLQGIYLSNVLGYSNETHILHWDHTTWAVQLALLTPFGILRALSRSIKTLIGVEPCSNRHEKAFWRES